LSQKVQDAARRCAVADVSRKLISKLSKGYRQRVGLAQAILHNPDVLILDEPTAGLDPKQISETRDLIRSLAGDHTIILSTHILSEVEQTCDHVIIISKGRVVAKDSVQHLTSRLAGQEQVAVEVAPRQGALEMTAVRQRLEQVPGVSRVVHRDTRHERLFFDVESLPGQNVRGEIARAVVEAGWNLNELRPSAVSLEEVFLELTATEQVVTAAPAQAAPPIEGDAQ
jgi:ABC-2 type transport system ATP-binding protein